MGSYGHLIRINVTPFNNGDSRIGKMWANRVGRAKDNHRARAVVGNVRMACEGLKAASSEAVRRVAARTWGDKAGGNQAPAAVRAAALEILSFWLLTRTMMVNCPAAKLQMQPRRSRRWIRTGTATSLATRCDPLIQVEGLEVPIAAAHPQVNHVPLRATTVHR